MTVKLITMAECKKHNTEEDCWLVMFDKVYDVTAFLDEHPGGSEIMVDVTGRDATDDFEDVVHSSTARKQLEGMYIGDLHPEDKAKLKGVANANGTSTGKATGKGASGPVNPLVTFIKTILPFLVLALAYVAYKSK